MPAIEIADVTRRFGSLVAVDQVDLDVGEGEIVGLIGHNGAGKTTLLRLINGLLPPDGGTIRVLGHDPTVEGEVVRRSTGVLTEYPALDTYLSAAENLRLYADIHGLPRAGAAARIALLLERLGLADRADEPSRNLSAGLKQRVALARALIHDPPVLLLDEPTTNMDPVAARTVRHLIVESVREHRRTVLLSTHNLPEAEQLCDRIAIIRQGQVLAIGLPSELRRRFGTTTGARIETGPEQLLTLHGLLAAFGATRTIDDVSVEVRTHSPVPEVVAHVVAAGMKIHRVEPLETTLEDLYVQLHASDPAAAGSLPQAAAP